MEFIVKTMFPDARLLTSKEAPGIIGCVEDIAKKAGCSAPPVYLYPSRAMNAAIYPAGQSMIIFQGALDKTGSKLVGKPSAQLEGIIAHEMGHWSNAFRHFGPMLAVIGGSTLIASAAVYMYDRAHMKQKQAKEEGKSITLDKGFSEAVDEMKHQSFWKNFKDYYAYNTTPAYNILGASDMQPGSWGEYMKRQVMGIGATAAGLAVSLPACRQFALRNEFEADAFAARITGNPEGYIEMLNTLHNKVEGAARHTAKRLGNTEAAPKVTKSAMDWFKHIMQETVMAHPSWEERIAAIRKIAPTITRIHP